MGFTVMIQTCRQLPVPMPALKASLIKSLSAMTSHFNVVMLCITVLSQ